MVEKKLYISVKQEKVNMALTEDHMLVEFSEKGIEDNSVLGRVYRAKVDSILPGMNAAFVDIGEDKPGYLPLKNVFFKGNNIKYKNIADCLKVGQEITVQVVKEAVDEKGAKLTMDIAVVGRRVILLTVTNQIRISSKIDSKGEYEETIKNILPSEMGCIVRTSAQGVPTEEIDKEIKYLCKEWEKAVNSNEKGNVPREIYSNKNSVMKFIQNNMDRDTEGVYIDNVKITDSIRKGFAEIGYGDVNKIHFYSNDLEMFACTDIDNQMRKMSARKVWLKCGGYLLTDKTEALTVIDVNTGKCIGKSDFNETILETNAQAADMAARLIRLKDIGGIILIDFLTMKKNEDRQKILDILKNRISNDPMRPTVYGFTKLGLVEIARKRR